VIGWALADHLRTELALAALRMAIATRSPAAGLAHHTDRGCQYTAADYAALLASHGSDQRLGRPGTCWDNAVAESFFATLKIALVDRFAWPTRQQARTAIFESIEAFYHRQRRHSILGYRSPAAFEADHHAADSAA
jgi:transposase InsO family protein